MGAANPVFAQTIKGNVYGGGQLASVTIDTHVQIKSGIIDGDVYGGGALANVDGNTEVSLIGGSINSAYGGGLGSKIGVDDATENVEAVIGGKTLVTLNGSVVNSSIFGCNNVNGTPKGHAKVHVLSTTKREEQGEEEYDVAAVYGGGNLAAYVPTEGNDFAEVLIENCSNSIEYVYGGGNAAPVPATKVTIKGANAIDNAFAGGNGAGADNPGADIGYKGFFSSGAATEYGTGIATINVQGGTIHHVYGGSNTLGYIKDHAVVNVEATGTCTMDVAELYGGGKKAPGKAAQINITCTGNGKIDNVYGGAHMANLTGDIELNIRGGNIGNAFGGNNESGIIDGSIIVNVNWNTEACGTNSLNNVYGAGNKADYTGSPVVNIINGKVNENVFGGGLEATVTGDPTVTVSGGTVIHDVYGGGALADVEGNTTVNLTGGAVGGAYGGALGSAEVAAKVYGDTYVHLNGSQVTGTGIFGANNLNGSPTGHVKVHVTNTTPRDGFDYHVPAVYGGGNKAAYVPTDDNDYTEVIIENCETSIEYVYGGGNAAPVPATDVKIYGANAIGNAFAGGNGAGADNPGADVGYLGYYSKGSREEYGSGTTDLTIYGGTVEKAFGGSNTLGYIRTHAKVELTEYPVEYEGSICDLHVGDVHGGGNHAEMFCDGTVILGCTEGAEAIYAGADNADINGNLEITITSGTFGKVFGGNNRGGCIKGSITVNIDETGCKPIYIGELYGCGDNAPYSVYGYNDDKSPRTSSEEMPVDEIQYDDPVVNLISFTKIGKVFGGGNGTGATVYGNPTVNINTIKGLFAGRDDLSNNDVPYIINNSDERVKNNEETIDIPDEVGTIGNVYGGGNKAAVFGNTRLNIGTEATANHISGNEEIKAKTEDVSVLILGNVFGGSKGVSDNPAAGRVTGTTKVIIGE